MRRACGRPRRAACPKQGAGSRYRSPHLEARRMQPARRQGRPYGSAPYRARRANSTAPSSASKGPSTQPGAPSQGRQPDALPCLIQRNDPMAFWQRIPHHNEGSCRAIELLVKEADAERCTVFFKQLRREPVLDLLRPIPLDVLKGKWRALVRKDPLPPIIPSPDRSLVVEPITLLWSEHFELHRSVRASFVRSRFQRVGNRPNHDTAALEEASHVACCTKGITAACAVVEASCPRRSRCQQQFPASEGSQWLKEPKGP
jgi:hypothetical protein